jgi:hypothetical protein
MSISLSEAYSKKTSWELEADCNTCGAFALLGCQHFRKTPQETISRKSVYMVGVKLFLTDDELIVAFRNCFAKEPETLWGNRMNCKQDPSLISTGMQDSVNAILNKPWWRKWVSKARQKIRNLSDLTDFSTSDTHLVENLTADGSLGSVHADGVAGLIFKWGYCTPHGAAFLPHTFLVQYIHILVPIPLFTSNMETTY